MNIKDLKASLKYLFKAQVTPFIWSHAGAGKSSVVKQVALENGYKFFPFYLGTQSDVGDILGLASFKKDENGSEIATQFAPPIWLKEMIDYCNENPESGAIVFLDEFNRARRDILNGMFSLALDKTFHTMTLPANCYIVAAGNPPTDEYFTTDVNETALMSRFVHIKLEPSFNEWLEYARANNFEHTLISFLQEQPELLQDSKSSFTLPVKVDGRSYERANKLFKTGIPKDLMEQLLLGVIGAERVVAYNLHLQKTDKPFSGAEVLSGQSISKVKIWANPNDIKGSLLSITCDNVNDILMEMSKNKAELSEEQGQHLFDFLSILPKDSIYPLLLKLVMKSSYTFKEFSKNPKYEDTLAKIADKARN